MDSARDTVTGEIIDAESLWDLIEIDRNRYRCVGCGTQVLPASFNRGVNKKRPYFTLGTSSRHIEPCNVDGEEKLVQRAAIQRISTEEGFPLPYPNRLLLTDYHRVVTDECQSGMDETAEYSTPHDSSGRMPSLLHGHTVKTIRPIARTFLRFPHDRDVLSLAVPGCEGSTFSSVFWRLGKIMVFRHPTHLFYAPLHWKAPVQTDSQIEWQLDAGDWNADLNRRGSAYRLQILWGSWSQSQKSTLLHEVEVTRQKAKTSGGEIKAWIFFVGTQNAEDSALLQVVRYQFICCLEGGRY